MSALHGALLAVRFLLELAALAALAYWGFSEYDGVAAVLLGVGAPLLAAVVWGLFVSPKAKYGSPVRQAIGEAIVFGCGRRRAPRRRSAGPGDRVRRDRRGRRRAGTRNDLARSSDYSGMVLLGIAFLAGLITAISPCVLPVLPILLAGGASGRRPYAIIAGLVGSFTVFTLAGAALLNALGLPEDFLRNLAIALLFLLAATLLFPPVAAWLERPLLFLTRRRAGTDRNGFVLGVSLGLVFVPCAGPVLAAVTALSAAGDVGVRTVLVTFFYALGAAVPMLAIAIGGQRIARPAPTCRDDASRCRRADRRDRPGDRARRRPALHDDRARLHRGAPAADRAERHRPPRPPRPLERRRSCRKRCSGAGADGDRPVDQLQAVEAASAPREGRPDRLLDVLVRELPADAAAPEGLGRDVPEGRARHHRRPRARVCVRARPVERAHRGAQARDPLSRRPRQRLRDLARVRKRVLAGEVPDRPGRPASVPPLRRRRLRPHRVADPSLPRRRRRRADDAGCGPHADRADDA